MAASLALSACGGSAGDPAQSKMEQKTLRVGVVNNAIGALPIWTGTDNGLFSAKGLDVTVQGFNTDGEALKALAGGKVDVVYADYARAIEAKSIGEYRLSLVAEGYIAGPGSVNLVQQGAVKFSVQSDVQRALANKGAIMVPDIGADAAVDFGVPALMLANALPANSSIGVGVSNRQAYMRPADQTKMPAALQAGQAGGAVMTEPFWSEFSAKSDLNVLLDLTTGANEDMPLGGYFAQQDFALDKVNTLKVFVEALNTAKVASSSRATVTAELTKHYTPGGTPIPDQAAAAVSLGTFPLTTNARRIQRVLDSMQSIGLAPFFKLDSMLPADAIR